MKAQLTILVLLVLFVWIFTGLALTGKVTQDPGLISVTWRTDGRPSGIYLQWIDCVGFALAVNGQWYSIGTVCG